MKQQMARACDIVVGVVDSSKLDASAFSAFALPGEIHSIITVVVAPAEGVEALRAAGIKVVLV
ncbi:MAG: hypothetical protein M3328_07580 [Chloroflexota bacterium]|nr:hypothetical protein [Chloroflexota bacterium]